MSAIPTIKVKHDSELGYQLINECDLTDDMVLYAEPSVDESAEEKPIVTAKKKAPVKG